MKAEIGKYKFGRHRSMWGIWQWDWVGETGSSARFVKDVFSYEEVKGFTDVIKISDVQIRGKANKMDIYEVLKVNL